MQILAISGSLRDASSNTTLLRAISHLAPENAEIVLYKELGNLPHFNPDLDNEPALPSVTRLRFQLQLADGVIISSPEYAHGLPGALKNALDWLVSSGETVDKAFALINASPRAHHAQEQLVEILSTMAARIIEKASITVPLLGKNLDEFGIIANAELSSLLSSAIVEFINTIEQDKALIKTN